MKRTLRQLCRALAAHYGLIVYAGKDFCRRQPKCGECPLSPYLKDGRPLSD
jgi:endonuclease III-like uncharacterized protein